MHKRIACVGSREISKEMAEFMCKLGEFIVSRGDYVSSGNCAGSDFSYAHGANKINPRNVILYLPWAKYNREFIVDGNRFTCNIKPEWEVLAEKFHPAWPKLSQGVKKLMARNIGIVYKADKLLAYLNHKKSGFGGTGQAWRYAEYLNLPRLDLSQIDINNKEDVEKVYKFLDF